LNPRIEPTLDPAGTPVLHVDPALRPGSGQRVPPLPAASGPSLITVLCCAVLFCFAAVVLAIVALRSLPPPITSYMLQSPVKPVQYHWVPASQIADTARKAVVAAEDQKFWTHRGFDVEAIQKAEQYNRNPAHHRRGASTISQQTVKNLFLWPGGYVRKAIEAGLTVLIEKIWGKDRILEMYLNIVEFGPGIYGVEAASQNYFGKPAASLTAEEAARLAAVLPNPRHWSVRTPGAYVQARTAWILGQMGYGAPGAPQEEPMPPASEMPDADGANDDAPFVAAPAAPADDPVPAQPPPAPAAAPDGGDSAPPSSDGSSPPSPAEAPPPSADKPPG
jgi:monofunctional biosynthetic peptidoglycan transglycosylase